MLSPKMLMPSVGNGSSEEKLYSSDPLVSGSPISVHEPEGGVSFIVSLFQLPIVLMPYRRAESIMIRRSVPKYFSSERPTKETRDSRCLNAKDTPYCGISF